MSLFFDVMVGGILGFLLIIVSIPFIYKWLEKYF